MTWYFFPSGAAGRVLEHAGKAARAVGARERVVRGLIAHCSLDVLALVVVKLSNELANPYPPSNPVWEVRAVREGTQSVLLARVQRRWDGGYPVSVMPDGTRQSYVAGTREELEEALAELLKDVRIAERIRSLAA